MRRPENYLFGVLLLVQVIIAAFIEINHFWPVFFVLLFTNVAGWALLVYFRRSENMTEKISPSIDWTLQIANETLPYLRRGLNELTAQKAAEIIQKIADVPAVAVTDKERVLAYLGIGCDRHQPGDPILTEATRSVIQTGQHKVVLSTKQLNCSVKNCNCPLAAAIIVPLKCRGEVVGSLKLYQTNSGHLPPHVIRLAFGIAQLLGLQMELAELDRQAQLITKAQLEALHAQINPHFFFNTLNTIIMYSRTNPQRARRLLIRLAEFFRQTLKRHGHFISLREELEFVHTYLVLEKARFGPKLQIIEEIDSELLGQRIPYLSLQPLVENAVKHGISPKLDSGAIKISAHRLENDFVLCIKDDGVGIPPEKIDLVTKPGYGSGNGVGLSNVHERLQSLYGAEFGLKIESEVHRGTKITIILPLNLQKKPEGGGIDAYEA